MRTGMWFGQQQGARDVVLLGAGFSKAVSCQFPLIKELGQYALDEAAVPQHERPEEGTGFEAWLSRIGEDQPYRSVEENLAARRLFVQMSTAIAGVMRTRQRSALQKEPLEWLDDLISVLHARQATVVSFNYDNVVECAVDGRCPIVPPTATKSSYLTNLVVREIWGRARTALAEAERLIVIGYSVPPEEQVASGMVADALRGPFLSAWPETPAVALHPSRARPDQVDRDDHANDDD
ncbi:MAG: hypothetical protein ACYDH5_19665, partial [Acidimicrobiales bacterium]